MATDEIPVSDDRDDDETDGMAVAAWATVATIAVLWLAFLWSMHAAGTGRGLW